MAESGIVEQKYLIIHDKTALPYRCIKTNQPISEKEYGAWDLPWLPGWLKVLMIFGPFFLLFAPLMTDKRCRVKAGISRSAKRRYQFHKALAVLLILGSLAIVPIGMALQSIPLIVFGCISFVFLFWGGFIWLILFSSPLRIARVEDEKFWIQGCSPEYLQSLE